MISQKVQGQKKRRGTMEAWPFWFRLLIVSVVTLPVLSDYQTTRLLHHHMMREKETLLHFFFHDTFTGNNPNSVMVAHANLTMNHHFQSLLPFGSIYVVGALLTEGPDLTSNVVGHAQGFYVSAGKELLMVVNCIDYGFTDGEFSGSSINMFSRNPETETEREVAVVGGRGKFRMARGFARLKTLFFNVTSALVEYQVTVVHY